MKKTKKCKGDNLPGSGKLCDSGKIHRNNKRHRSGFLSWWRGLEWWGKVCLILSMAGVIGFLVWLTIRMVTMKVDITTELTFAVPEFVKLDKVESMAEPYAVAIDGQVVVGNDEVHPIASTAKMILGLAVMEEKPFSFGEKGEMITITDEMYERYAWYLNNNGSNTKVVLGEEISEYDALASVFLASSNNMADTLAIWAFGSLDNYREYANKMLAKLKLENTTVGEDASGFSPSTTSTTSDLARLGQLVLAQPVLKEIVGLKSYEVPVAGLIENTNRILGMNRIIGVKTGYIGEASGYCLVSGYMEGEHIVTEALLGASTRVESFNDSLEVAVTTQNTLKEQVVAKTGQVVGYYESWWTGAVPIRLKEDLKVLGWKGADTVIELKMAESDIYNGTLEVKIGDYWYQVAVETEEFKAEPSFGERLSHCFGWEQSSKKSEDEKITDSNADGSDSGEGSEVAVAEKLTEETAPEAAPTTPVTSVPSGNCTIGLGYLMLINPNFTVTTDFIDARRSELVSVSQLYGIQEGNAYNGDNLLDAEAAAHLNEMVKAYEVAYPGHTFTTFSCYRARGTSCGRLCAATGTSDHHTGLTCDLVDTAYGTSLDTDTYDQHVDWQWLYANSYKYGFIDRFPAEWAGGLMAEPLNVDENGSTGLFETWHYRYVGVGPATEIATGKYNNGRYDSLEHYLKVRGMVKDLKSGTCN
ncbi:D-alanyl-D-alanine carboxypeptidase family protein [Candidatus Saccharibacteria bacterium]|nr:D-alanyl-D-alanine carboxypeptidase family protein [Candidatus Saccharibacteria bacterium]